MGAAVLPARAGAHVGDAAGIALGWNFDPWVVGLLCVSGLLYAAGTYRLWMKAGAGRGVGFGHAVAFAAGWLVLWAALVSPLDALGSRSLSAHMVQHELLMLLAAPLLVSGRPMQAWTWALGPGARRAAGALTRARAWQVLWRGMTAPLSAWSIHAAIVWLWHAPVLFQAALASEALHTLQHASFLAAALLFWWAVCGPLARGYGHGNATASLFTTMLHTGALGALLTFSPSAWYPLYALRQVPNSLPPMEDQALAGLIMWIPGGLVYLAAGLWVASHWLAHATREAPGPGAAPPA